MHSIRFAARLLYLTVFLPAFLTASATGGERTSLATLADGLVAYYPFTGNANDASGHQHHGIVFGATLTTDRFGNANSAYAFNGINSYIEVSHDSALNPTAALSYSVWFQTNSTSQPGNILIEGDDQAAGHYTARIESPSKGNLSLGLQFSGDTYGTRAIRETSPFETGRWYLLTVTYDGAVLKGYIDGALRDSQLIGKGLATNNGVLSIGRHPVPGYEYWYCGKIDDIRIYDRALTDNEVLALWQENGYAEPTPGLIAYFPFAGNANDASGHGHDGKVHGASLTTDRFGNPNSAYTFDGFSSYIEVAHDSTLTPTAALSFGVWFQTNSTSQPGNIMIEGDDQAVGHYVARVEAPSHSNLSLGVQFSGDTYGTRAIRTIDPFEVGRWYFLTVTYDGAVLKGYLDGALRDSQLIAKPLGTNNGVLSIGRHPVADYPYWFSGKIDDIRLYNRALSSNEVNALYHEGGYSSDSLPPWEYVNTGISHTIIIPTSASPVINGVPLAVGDDVGVFYDSSGTEVCAGFERWTGTLNIAVTAHGDDPTTLVKDGFSEGEEFHWKIFHVADQGVYDATATYTPVGGIVTNTDTYTTNGISQLASLSTVSVSQQLSLRAGWNLVSSYVAPLNSAMDSIFRPIMDELIIVKSGDGKSFIPAASVNSIGAWDNGQGYQAKLWSARALTIVGSKVFKNSTPISIPAGWSIIPYLQSVEEPITTELADISSAIVIVKDQDGKAYIPSESLNGIGDLKPGQGYQIKMSAGRTFSYPSSKTTGGQKSIPNHSRSASLSGGTQLPPWSYTNTGMSHIIVISANVTPMINGTPISAGDYVGVFYDSSGTSRCGGYEMWNGSTAIAVAAFGDDPTTPGKDGFSPHEAFSWRVWRQSDGKGLVASAAYVPVGGIFSDSDAFSANGISGLSALVANVTGVVDQPVVKEFALLQNYPNPFNPTTNIQFALPSRSHVVISLFNPVGQELRELADADFEPGYHTVQFDGRGLASGIYFYRLQARRVDGGQAGSFIETRKLVLLR